VARTRTLLELRNDVLWQSDNEGNTARVSDARLTRAINQSIQEFREAVSDAGHPYYLRQSTGTLTVGATSPYPFGAITISALSPALLRPYGFDIQVGDYWVTVDPGNFDERNDGQAQGWISGPRTGQPEKFFLFNETQLAYTPAADQAYSYILYYLPVGTDLSADGDTFDGLAGWEEWVIYNAVAKLAIRDNHADHLALVASERQRLLEGILRRAPHRQRAGATTKTDVRGRRGGASGLSVHASGGAHEPAQPVHAVPSELAAGARGGLQPLRAGAARSPRRARRVVPAALVPPERPSSGHAGYDSSHTGEVRRDALHRHDRW
jgi:hypothetical protein